MDSVAYQYFPRGLYKTRTSKATHASTPSHDKVHSAYEGGSITFTIMKSHNRRDTITPAILEQLVAQYDTVVPTKLKQLDIVRYQTTPSIIAQRRAGGDPHVRLEELTALVEWKLSHGTFRPSLKKLVAQNSDEFVQETTRTAFSAQVDDTTIKTVLQELCRLRGIGPATASLLLSASDSERLPFFSDELFRWCHWEDKRQHGWDRPIKYTIKEYLDMYTRVSELRQRFEKSFGNPCSAVDVEKAAYVLAHEQTAAVDADKKRPTADSSRPSKRKRSAKDDLTETSRPRRLHT